MAKEEPMQVNVIVTKLTEEELRKIIREEVGRLVEPGAQRPPYLPTPPARWPGGLPWWQNPVIAAASVATPDKEVQVWNG